MTTTIVSGNTTSTETIVAVAARELAGKRRVFAGVGLPTLAVDLARHTSNPDVELIYESGVCGAHPSAMAEGSADSVVVSGAESVLSMAALFGYVLQGGGGAVESIANAAEIFVVMRRHDLSSFPAALDFCTSPSPARAHASGKGIMPAGAGVTKVFTNLGVLTHQGPGGELELTSVHEGISVHQVREATGWDLAVADHVTVTTPPSGTEIDLLRNTIDKVRLYLR